LVSGGQDELHPLAWFGVSRQVVEDVQQALDRQLTPGLGEVAKGEQGPVARKLIPPEGLPFRVHQGEGWQGHGRGQEHALDGRRLAKPMLVAPLVADEEEPDGADHEDEANQGTPRPGPPRRQTGFLGLFRHGGN
jgi:hypothetical protein